MREPELDILKGIGIVLVLVGHGLSGYVDTFAASFHMPLFFLVSGYFFKAKPIGDAIRADFKRLCLPFFFSVGVMLVGSFLLDIVGCKGVISPRYAMEALIYGNASPWNYGKIWGNWAMVGSVWFLAALFWARIIFGVLLKCGEKQMVLFALMLGGLGVLVGQYLLLPYSILQGISALPFLLIGYYARKVGGMRSLVEQIRGSRVLELLSAVLIVGWVASTFYPSINMADFHYNLWYYPNVVFATAGTFVAYCVSSVISTKTKFISGILSFLGRNTIILVCFPVLESFLIPLNLIIPDMQYKSLVILVCKVCWCVFAFVLVYNVGVLRRLFGVRVIAQRSKVEIE